MNDTAVKPIGTQRKIILGETLLVPLDTIVRGWFWKERELTLQHEGPWGFIAGFVIRLQHANFSGGYGDFQAQLMHVPTEKPRGRHPSGIKASSGTDESVWAEPVVQRAVRTYSAAATRLQSRIVDLYESGEVDARVLADALRDHLRRAPQ